MEDVIDVIRMIKEQAKVHDKQDCFGLPLCVSCRCAALIKNEFVVTLAEAWINTQEPGTVVRLD